MAKVAYFLEKTYTKEMVEAAGVEPAQNRTKCRPISYFRSVPESGTTAQPLNRPSIASLMRCKRLLRTGT